MARTKKRKSKKIISRPRPKRVTAKSQQRAKALRKQKQQDLKKNNTTVKAKIAENGILNNANNGKKFNNDHVEWRVSSMPLPKRCESLKGLITPSKFTNVSSSLNVSDFTLSKRPIGLEDIVNSSKMNIKNKPGNSNNLGVGRNPRNCRSAPSMARSNHEQLELNSPSLFALDDNEIDNEAEENWESLPPGVERLRRTHSVAFRRRAQRRERLTRSFDAVSSFIGATASNLRCIQSYVSDRIQSISNAAYRRCLE